MFSVLFILVKSRWVFMSLTMITRIMCKVKKLPILLRMFLIVLGRMKMVSRSGEVTTVRKKCYDADNFKNSEICTVLFCSKIFQAGKLETLSTKNWRNILVNIPGKMGSYRVHGLWGWYSCLINPRWSLRELME